jgi:hypothetical protein
VRLLQIDGNYYNKCLSGMACTASCENILTLCRIGANVWLRGIDFRVLNSWMTTWTCALTYGVSQAKKEQDAKWPAANSKIQKDRCVRGNFVSMRLEVPRRHLEFEKI